MKCAECFYLYYISLSHLCVNFPSPDLLQIFWLPFSTLPSNVFALATFMFLQTILLRKSITLAPKEKYCTLSAMTKWNMFEANHVFPRVRDYAICSRNMFLMCLASVTPCDCNFHCLLEFMISEATAHLIGHFWNVKPGEFTGQGPPLLLRHLVFEEWWRLDSLFHLEPQTNGLSKPHGSIMLWELISHFIWEEIFSGLGVRQCYVKKRAFSGALQ